MTDGSARPPGPGPSRPPRLAEALLERALPATVRDAILGDLEEQFAARMRRDGRPAAVRWYARQTLAALSPLTRIRLAAAYRRDGGRVGGDERRPGGHGRVGGGAAGDQGGATTRGAGPRDAEDRGGRWAMGEPGGGSGGGGSAWTATRNPGRSLPDALGREGRLALRRLARAPGYTVAVVATLALGIGANTAVFSVVRGVLLRPLDYRDPDRLVWFWEHNPSRGWDRAEVAPANFLEWRSEARSFTDLTAVQDWPEELVLEGPDGPQVVHGIRVFGNFFDVLGVPPALGRGFTVEETWEGSDGVAVLSYALWQARYGGDPGVVGRDVVLDGTRRTVVGVTAPDFRTPEIVWSAPNALAEPTDVWIPFGWAPSAPTTPFFRTAHIVQAIGRLAPGVEVAAARREIEAIMERLEARHPETNAGMGAGLEPLDRSIAARARLPLALLMGAVGLVLLVACANVANLALVRGLDGRGPAAVRLALGAGRSDLVVQVLAESLLLALGGGALGLVLGRVGVDLLVGAAPAGLPRVDAVALDVGVLMFTALLTAGTGVLFAFLPALRAAGPGPRAALAASGSRAGGPSGAPLTPRVLVAAEVALAVMLVAGAGLLTRSLLNLRSVETGFQTEGVLAVRLSPPATDYPTLADVRRFYDRLVEEARALPGVSAAALTSRLPLQSGWTSPVVVDGWEPGRVGQNVKHREVSPGYLKAAGTPLLDGRALDRRDLAEAEPAVVVNRSFAERWLGPEPVGRRITFDDRPDSATTWFTVVGVVEDQRQEGLRADPPPEVLGAWAQIGGRSGHLLLRTDGAPAALAPAVRRLVEAADPRLVLYEAVTLEEVIRADLAEERFLLGLVAVFSGLALFLALLGVWGVTSWAARRRTRELGLRAALGAAPCTLMREGLVAGMLPVAGGLAAGLGGSVWVGEALGSVLYGVSPTDPATLIVVVAAVTGAALLASWGPARRAGRVDPATVLREG